VSEFQRYWIGAGIAKKSCAERHRVIWFERVGICRGGALRIDHRRRPGFMSQQSCQSCIITIDPTLYKGQFTDRNRQSFLITSFTLCLYFSWNQGGGRLSSGKYVGTICLRAAGSSPAPPAVWIFWRLIRRTESLDRGLILVCRFSFISSRECILVAAQTRSCLQGWMHVRDPLLLPNG
jgi:hypothetical protein